MNMFRKLILPLVAMAFFGMCKEPAKEMTSEQGVKDPACASKVGSQCDATKECTNNGTSCVVSAAFCRRFTPQTECAKMTSCTWNTTSQVCDAPNASGDTTKACTQIVAAAECSANFNCEWNPNITTSNKCTTKSNTGTTGQCRLYTDQASCASRMGCQWDGYSSCLEASSTTGQCQQYKDQTSCGSRPNCRWDGYNCVDSTLTNGQCNQYRDQASCGSRVTCRWDGYNCLDSNSTNIVCTSIYNQQQCLSPTCVWNLNTCKYAGGQGQNDPTCIGKAIPMCLISSTCTVDYMSFTCKSKY